MSSTAPLIVSCLFLQFIYVFVSSEAPMQYRPNRVIICCINSSVARGGVNHWLAKHAKLHVFGAFEADFW